MEEAKKPAKPSYKPKEADRQMSEEAEQRKANIELMVGRVMDPDNRVAKMALEMLSKELKTATSSMISVPLSLKFLRSHLGTLETFYQDTLGGSELKELVADLISVLASSVRNSEKKCLKYSLEGTRANLSSWGQEYLRNLSSEIISEFQSRQTEFLKRVEAGETGAFDASDLLGLVYQIVPYYMEHQSEIDAIDLLVEVQQVESIRQYVDLSNYKRVTKYLMGLSSCGASDDDFEKLLAVCYDIFLSLSKFCEAERVALKLKDDAKLARLFAACEDPAVRLQMAYLLRCHGHVPVAEDEFGNAVKPPFGADVRRVLSNEWLSASYAVLAKELEVEEAKVPEDVYKTHLEEKRKGTVSLDSQKQHVAGSIVNAFLNAGFCSDGLLTTQNSNWIFKGKDYGLATAAASLGCVMLWNVEKGYAQIDKYQWSSDALIKGGSLMAFGLCSCGISNECDAAFSLLSESLASNECQEQVGALLGLSFSEIGTQRQSLLEALIPFVIDTALPVAVSAEASLTLSLTFISTGNRSVAEALVQTLVERQQIGDQLDDPLAYLFGLSLGLVYLGLKDVCESAMEELEAVNQHPLGKYASITLLSFAYAATGDLSKVQQFLKICVDGDDVLAEDAPVPEVSRDSDSIMANAGTDDGHAVPPASVSPMWSGVERSVAAFSISLVSYGDHIANEMLMRLLDRMLQYGSVSIKKAVPLCYALSAASNPSPIIIDILSRLTHDSSPAVCENAVFALGIVGLGTNNAKIAELLRHSASSYSKTSEILFMIRIAQGLLYAGKGLLTVSPLHSDKGLINNVALGCLAMVIHTAFFTKNTIHDKYPYLLFYLVPALRPRMLMTLDEDLNVLRVPVRVGVSVDTTGQAGTPRDITAFQTYTTPVLLAMGEKAELATSDYLPVASIPLEGTIILRKAPSEDRESSTVVAC